MSDNQFFSHQYSSLQETIQVELEETRRDFLALLATLSEADFRQKSIASAWTIKELLVHIVFWLRETPRVVKVVRTGRGIRSIGEYRTIETIIRSHHTHFQEHATEIWQSLSREETRGASCAHSQHLDA